MTNNSDMLAAIALLLSIGAQRENINDIYYILLNRYPNFHHIADPSLAYHAAVAAVEEYNEYRYNQFYKVY